MEQDAWQRRDWKAVHDDLARRDAEQGLNADELWRFGLAAYLTGRDAVFESALERAHHLHHFAGALPAAARCAFWLGFHLADRGDSARASGWLARAMRLLGEAGGEHVEHGYLLVAEAMRRFSTGDATGAYDAADRAVSVAQRFAEADLLVLAVHVQGRALIVQQRVADGLRLLDEAMLAVSTDRLAPHVTGLIYCSVIGACRSVFALGRAQEWTAALSDWCDRQPDMIAYTGECRVYRAELLQLHGSWLHALQETHEALERTAQRGGPARALAHYECGELHRLTGAFAEAETAFDQARRAGREPQPGLALLRLVQGKVTAAASAIRRALAETGDPLKRGRLLPAHIEIMIEAGAVEEARTSCEELQRLARSCESPVLLAQAAGARGATTLATGTATDALPHLRHAQGLWTKLNAPYERARTAVLLGIACRAAGDEEAATGEFDAAHALFAELGARPDLIRLEQLRDVSPIEIRTPHGLTRRELDVLRLLATGRTNRAIAEDLFISEKTVARHVSNIFGKLGLASRAAATAYAYEHRLI
jgi:DNA-binding CsgD family transcriptional regulator